jgi:hypothetical protein
MVQLIRDIIEGLARFGCDQIGIPYPYYDSEKDYDK